MVVKITATQLVKYAPILGFTVSPSFAYFFRPDNSFNGSKLLLNEKNYYVKHYFVELSNVVK